MWHSSAAASRRPSERTIAASSTRRTSRRLRPSASSRATAWGLPGRSGLSLQRCSKTDTRRTTRKSVQPLSRVGTQAFNRDAAGQIVARNNGALTWVGHGGDPGAEFEVQPVQLQLVDLSWIDAHRAIGVSRPVGGSTTSPDHRMDADCHGVSFTQGEVLDR